MRRSRILPLGAGLVLCALNAFAQRPALTDKAAIQKGKDSAPWHITKVAKLSRAVNAKASTASQSGPQKYLHVEIRYNLPPKQRAQHRFRVTDRRGKAVGELWGSSRGRSLLIFEGRWADLRGLYLDGAKHREPLVRERVAATDATAKTRRDLPKGVDHRSTAGLPARPDAARVSPLGPVVPTAPSPVSGRTNVGVGRGYATPAAADAATDAVAGAPGNSGRVSGTAAVGRDGAPGAPGSRMRPSGRAGPAVGGRNGVNGGSPNTSGTGGRGADSGQADSASNASSPSPGRGQGPSDAAATGTAPRAGDSGAKTPAPGQGPGTSEGSAAETGQEQGRGRDSGAGSAEDSRPQSDASPAAESDAQDGAGEGPGEGSRPGDAAGETPGRGRGSAEGDETTEGEGPAPAAAEGAMPEADAGGEPGTQPAPGEAGRPDQDQGEMGDRGEDAAARPADGAEQQPYDNHQPEQPAAAPNQTPADPTVASGDGGSGAGRGSGTGPGRGPGGRGRGGGTGVGGGGPGLGGGPGSGGGTGVGSGSRLGSINPFRSPGGPGYGSGRGVGYGQDPGDRRGSPPAESEAIKDGAPLKLPVMPEFVLYISTGDESGPGTVYQVDEHGRVLGKVRLPYTATGMALHRTHGLVLAIPRDNGRIMRIDETGKLSTLLQDDRNLVHPVDVGISGNSDTVLVADNTADVLAATTTGGTRSKLYERFEGQKWDQQDMSVAVTNDKHVILGTNGDEGIYRFAGDDYSASADPILAGTGGVAADPKSLRWAATQRPNQVHVFEGEEPVKRLRLPAGKSLYRQGLLSFSPCGSICVAARDRDEIGEPWFLMYDIEKDGIRSLFPWKGETMTDFVVGPRMLWNRNSPDTYRSIY